MNIKINIANKHCTVEGAPVIVCGNSDYTLQLTMDDAWGVNTYKTARFVYVQRGVVKHLDVVFTGDTVAVPVLSNTTEVKVGIFEGELQTTTPAVIPCQPSILCGSGEPAAQTPELAAQVLVLLNRLQAEQSPAIVGTVSGETVSTADSADRPLHGLALYGKTTQNGTPTPDAPIALVSVGSAGHIAVSVTGAAPDSAQALQVSTPDGLPGIPVVSGGNYTDANGQQWLCDELDFAKGVYIQRVGRLVLKGTENWNAYGSSGGFSSPILKNAVQRASATAKAEAYCTHAAASSRTDVKGDLRGVSVSGTEYLLVNFSGEHATAKDLNAYLKAQDAAGTPVTVLYRTSSTTETALPPEDLAAYAKLRTNKPGTTVNTDCDAGLKLEYVVDTKTYIDNKFSELAAALVANT